MSASKVNDFSSNMASYYFEESPDDFDIPVDDSTVVAGPDFGGLEVEVIFDPKASLGYCVKRYNALCKMFVWIDKEGEPHTLKDIDDNYLQNIINFLKRNLGERPDYDINPYDDDIVSTEQEQDELDTLIKFLEKVQHNRGRRGSYASKLVRKMSW